MGGENNLSARDACVARRYAKGSSTLSYPTHAHTPGGRTLRWREPTTCLPASLYLLPTAPGTLPRTTLPLPDAYQTCVRFTGFSSTALRFPVGFNLPFSLAGTARRACPGQTSLTQVCSGILAISHTSYLTPGTGQKTPYSFFHSPTLLHFPLLYFKIHCCI